jgi:hypothetical protein
MKVLVSLSGGLVQCAYLDDEAAAAGLKVVIADYDVEGTRREVSQDPEGDPVLIWEENPIVESKFAGKMFALEDPESGPDGGVVAQEDYDEKNLREMAGIRDGEWTARHARFSASVVCDRVMASMDRLLAAGLATEGKRGGTFGQTQSFHPTEAGCLKAGLTPEQAQQVLSVPR